MQAVINSGVILTAVYGLLAMGYVVVYRASGVLNFVHGAMMLLGAYLGFELAHRGIAALIGIPLVVLIGFGVGWVFYFAVMRRMAGQPPWASVLVTVGFGFFIAVGLFQLIWGPEIRSLNGGLGFGFGNSVHKISSQIFLTTFDFVLIIGFVVAFVALLAFYRFSRLGVLMRAASQDHHLAAYRAINIDAMFALSWAIATAIGMFAGFVYAADYQLDMANVVLALKAFPVAMVGGLDSLGGVLFGALLVGMSESAVQYYVDPLWAEVVPFLILLGMLLIRPWGLFGTPEMIDRV